MAFVYALQDPRTLDVKYIGSANDPHKRYKAHLRETPRLGIDKDIDWTPKALWLYELFINKLAPTLILLTECEISEKLFWESFWQCTCSGLYAPPSKLLNRASISIYATAKR